MTLIAGLWVHRDTRVEENIPGTLKLTSPDFARYGLASDEKQTCRKEINFPDGDGDRNGSSRGCGRPHFSILRTVCCEDRPASLFLFQRPVIRQTMQGTQRCQQDLN
jgi:hypothetical protein